jgi:hypothetical protein
MKAVAPKSDKPDFGAPEIGEADFGQSLVRKSDKSDFLGILRAPPSAAAQD